MKNRLKLLILLLSFSFLLSCNLSNTGKVQLHIHTKQSMSDLDTIEVWCPYNYYCINWQVEQGSGGEEFISGSGMSKGDELFGSFNIMNNYMNNNLLDVDSINKVLAKTQVEIPHLILYRKYILPDSTYGSFKMFILFTKNEKLYNDKKKLLYLSKNL